MDLADIMLRGLDQGAGVASRAMSFTQQAEQLRRLRELDRYQQEQDALNYGLRQADDARADQRFAFDQEQAGLRNQQYAQQEQRLRELDRYQQEQAEEEKARKGQAWNLMQSRRKSRGGPTPDAMVDMWEESQLAQDAGVPDYAWRETQRQREAQAKAAQQAAMVQQVAQDLQTLFPRAQPGKADAAARLRANDFPVGLGDANLSGETRAVPLSQNAEYQALALDLKDAEDAADAAKSAYSMVRSKANKAAWDQAMEGVRMARESMRTVLRGGGQPAPAGAPASPTSAVAPAADPIESVLTELERTLGRPPTEEEAWRALNGGG